MRVAVAAPMPGSASSCASVAAFRLSGAGPFAGGARRRFLRGQVVRRQRRNGQRGGDESGGERREHVRSPGKPRGPSGGERCPAHGDVRGRVMGVSPRVRVAPHKGKRRASRREAGGMSQRERDLPAKRRPRPRGRRGRRQEELATAVAAGRHGVGPNGVEYSALRLERASAARKRALRPMRGGSARCV